MHIPSVAHRHNKRENYIWPQHHLVVAARGCQLQLEGPNSCRVQRETQEPSQAAPHYDQDPRIPRIEARTLTHDTPIQPEPLALLTLSAAHELDSAVASNHGALPCLHTHARTHDACSKSESWPTAAL